MKLGMDILDVRCLGIGSVDLCCWQLLPVQDASCLSDLFRLI